MTKGEAMGLFDRIKAVWYAMFNESVTELEDKHIISLAETKINEATRRLKDARQGLISYQALVLKVQKQIEDGKKRSTRLTAQIKMHLKEGNEDIASQMAMELNQVKSDLASNEEQLGHHQQAYEANLLRMKAALKDIKTTREDLEKKKAALAMEKALAEVSETAGALDTEFDVSTDLGQIMSRVDDQIHRARARTQVAADLSSQDLDRLKAQQSAEKVAALDLLDQFKIEEGLVEPPSTESEKTVGPERQSTREPEKN